MIPLPVPNRYAEVVRYRNAGGRPSWGIDRIVRDERDGSTQRVNVAERDNLRDLLQDARALERQGVHVNRAGLAR